MKAARAKKPPVKREWWWQLRVELLEITPPIWRRVIVPESITLPTLHRVLQACMGWTDSHLHEFIIGGVRYSTPDPDWSAELHHQNERGVVLYKALGVEARCFDYVYDFGDDWHHVILLEDRYASPTGRAAGIQCVAGENACPPEDVGGPHGYRDFLLALADQKHEQHAEYREWRGNRAFDPANFELSAAQRALARIKN